jgi:hypothetical protein
MSELASESVSTVRHGDRAPAPALRLRDVRKSYQGSPPVESVRGVTL